MEKILFTNEVKKKLELLNKKKKIIGLSHGVFDLLHLGHIKHFQEAKKFCDILVVSVTDDKFVFKGPGRPKFNSKERMEALAALQSVDYVILSDSLSAEQNISLLKPNFYFKGPDYKNTSDDITGKINLENKIVKKFGGKTIYTSATKFSSTLLLNYFEKSDRSKDYLQNYVKKNFTFNKIKKLIHDLKTVKPLIIGEVIIDEYNFCEALGKSGKEPMLVVKDLFKEQYLGGSGAICNHLSEFNDKVQLLSYVGEHSEHINFIKKKLNKNTTFSFIKKKNSSTIIKKRFIDEIVKSKILGLYSLNDSFVSKTEEKKLINKFNKLTKKSDITIISDYGHGLITKNFAEKIKKRSKFVAANSQINSSNIGHHTLDFYKNADLMIINEKELRHEMRSKNEKIPFLMKKLSENMKFKYLVVTRGNSGCLLFHRKNKKFYNSKAYSNLIVDKIGAGDTMLSILAICLLKKIDINLSLLISSFCAAQSVKTIGNKVAVNKNLLLKDLEYYLS